MNAVVEQEAHRAFLYGLLARNPQRRAYIVWNWLLNYHPPEDEKTQRQVWYTILKTLLWQRSDFVVESYKFLLLGPAFPVRYEWLTARERRSYIVGNVFANRKTLFKTVNVLRNNTVCLEGFLPTAATTSERDPVEAVWRRQWVRDIAGWVHGHVALEFTCAVQQLALERGDIFLSELFATLNGCGLVAQLPCWGLGPQDRVRPLEEEEGTCLKTMTY
jgi:hypothetical protein